MAADSAAEKFEKLLDVMAELRGAQGCPWDREQTHVSLKPCLLEETYELLEALDDGDPKKLREELGDVLLQVVFHSQIAAEDGRFTIKDV
ncbi:MAG TPA: MazG nucleotide pyrophosphohydrolase domain-containing protein, partial [Candidatus Binatia bacterium]